MVANYSPSPSDITLPSLTESDDRLQAFKCLVKLDFPTPGDVRSEAPWKDWVEEYSIRVPGGFGCPNLCKERLSRRKDMWRHWTGCRRSPNDVVRAYKRPCSYGCGYGNLQKSNVDAHERRKHGRPKLHCGTADCKYECADDGQMTRHRQKKHGSAKRKLKSISYIRELASLHDIEHGPECSPGSRLNALTLDAPSFQFSSCASFTLENKLPPISSKRRWS